LRVLLQLMHGMHNGVHAAEEKDGDRGNQIPEIAFLPVTEMMFLIRLALRTAQTEIKQSLIGRIGQRVHCLGKQSAGTGNKESEEFCDCDQTVAGQRGQNRLGGTVGHISSEAITLTCCRKPATRFIDHAGAFSPSDCAIPSPHGCYLVWFSG